jgi:hypothetical protein
VNAGETHYPYLMPRGSVPHLCGIRGAAESRTDASASQRETLDCLFERKTLQALHASQIEATTTLDRRLGYLLDILPKPIFLVFVSDHGELFGENGLFGHGPFFHKVLFEVPLAFGVVK